MWKAVKYVLVYYAFQIAVAILLMIPILALKGNYETAIPVSLLISAVLFCWYIVSKREVRLLKESFSVRPWTILLPCVLIWLAFLLPELMMSETLELPDVMNEEMEQSLLSVFGLIAVGIVVPVAEEFLFRGAVLGSLLKWKQTEGRPWLAVLLSAVIFAVVHLNPAQMPGAFFMGLLFGWLCYRTGSLLPGIIIHILNNSLVSIAGIIDKLYPSEEPEPETIAEAFGSPGLEYLAIGLSLIVLVECVLVLVRMVNRHYPLRQMEEPAPLAEGPAPEPVSEDSVEMPSEGVADVEGDA